MLPWLQYLFAFVVVPGALKEWRGSSWLLASSLAPDQLRVLFSTLHVSAGIAILACAVAAGVQAWGDGTREVLLGDSAGLEGVSP